MSKDYEETIENCSKILMTWFFNSKGNKYIQGEKIKNDNEIANIFTSQVLLKKFDVFNIDIQLPDELLLMLAICTNGNPGQVQIILKDLLLSIKKHKGPIKPGYIIEHQDFVECFPMQFPIMAADSVNKKYEKLWNAQKKTGKTSPAESDNLCDTPEWWLEVME